MSCYSCSFFFSSRRRHTRCSRDWSSDVCSSDLDLVFDADAADHVCRYLSALGLRLLPFQVFVLTNLYGFKLPTGERRYREAYVELARKNGKSTLAGGLCLYHLDEIDGDREMNAEVYIGSTSKRQSETVTSELQSRLHLVCRLLLEKK